jgi:serine/threonine protein phosphatase PrpC
MNVFTAWAGRTDRGLVRQLNEDSAYAGRWLYAVADGMGGHAAGEVASASAIAEVSRHDSAVPSEHLVDALSAAMREANTSIRRMVESDPQLHTMGTTLTAMLWSGRAFALGHIGDSRAYRMRGSQLRQLTEDHSLSNLVAAAGASPLAPIITRYFDGRPDRSPDLAAREALPGDRYLLCSDGLSGVVRAPAIAAALSSGDSLDRIAGELTRQAIDLGGPDNVTVILIEVTGEPASQEAPVFLGSVAESGSHVRK